MHRRATAPDDLPLGDSEFTDLMRCFAPFEARPALALAVSGGRDSRALALLASRWATRRRGRAVALVVDHGLRDGSAAEAAATGAWLQAHAIEAHVLCWRPARRPVSGLQAAARAARYRLLLDWCRDNGVLHLLTAHQADDQAETFALRAGRGSGPVGLAGMSAIVEFPEARLLRPLLAVPRDRLTLTLQARGEPWIDDPSNIDVRFARARLRRDGMAMTQGQALAKAAQFANARMAEEARLATAIASCATPHPLGGVIIDHGAWRAMPAGLVPNTLATIVAMVAGADYGPRRERLAGAVARLRAAQPGKPPPGLTLGGCRILWRGGGWLVVREPAAIAMDTDGAKALVRWDGRFEWRDHPAGRGAAAGHTKVMPPDGIGEPTLIGSLDRTAWARAWPATPGLPALLAALPQGVDTARPAPIDVEGGLDVSETRRHRGPGYGWRAGLVVFRPGRPLAAGPFFPCFDLGKGQIVNHVAT